MEKKSLPIKTDLFRFVTFRNPEHLTFHNKDLRFVTHPNLEKSIIKACPCLTGKEKSIEKFEEFTKKFPVFSNMTEVRKVNPELFDYANDIQKMKVPIGKIKQDEIDKVQKLSIDQETQLFEALIGEVLSRKSKDVRQSISQMLIVNHAIKNSIKLKELGLKKLTDIKIEIPYQVIECYKPWWFSKCGGSLEGVQNLGIADFRRVEQEVCCYVPGEVSHIENVMAKEYKERTTRNYVRTENTLEISRETEIENLTDVTTATRNEISNEIASVLEEEHSKNYGGSLGVSGKYLGAEINVNAYADFATSNSSSYSDTESKTYAEEVTKRALERIVQKTSEKRTSKIIKEFEENNKHGFDNRGEKAVNVTGIYRWIDIIYKNRLVNYGKRLMVEFMVPEPAKFYKRILKYKVKTQEDSDTQVNIENEKPKTLAELGINSANDITRDNYNIISQNYSIILNTPFDEFKLINISILPPCPKQSDNSSKSYNQAISIEPFYEADSLSGKVDINYTWHKIGGGPSPVFKMDIGNFNVSIGSFPRGGSVNKSQPFGALLNPKYTESLDVNFDYKKMNSITASIEIKCKLIGSKFQEWQNECYQKLIDAYNSALDTYNNSLETNNAENEMPEESKTTNPDMNRIIEQRELKRICIEMLMKPYCRAQGRNNNIDINACDLYQIPQVNQTHEFSEYVSMVKFFEQAIDWQIMSYLFYPYYWAYKCDWADLMKSESDDLVFQAFLQSGMARVVVPIRQQFNEAFAYYLETGEIWLGNEFVAGSRNDLYLSIAEEMQDIRSEVEEVWETRVPTTLAIIQAKSACLEQEGLPCCNKIENDETTTNIVGTEKTLDIIKPE